MSDLLALQDRITRCQACPRLRQHCQAVAKDPPKRFRGQEYWGRPVPGFGDPAAGLLVVGLAPAANGANRTGRMFTGDQSGLWLYRALHAAGFASQATSESRTDGLTLKGAYITNAARCAPPDNKPSPEEMASCAPYLQAELRLLSGVRVVVCLGQIAWKAYLGARKALGGELARPLPAFGHLAEARLPGDGLLLLGSYHPSQQNTFTGRLTQPMLQAVFDRARDELAPKAPARKRKK